MDQNADILPKLWCQNVDEMSGIIAIESRMPIKGIMLNKGKSEPKFVDDANSELSKMLKIRIHFIVIKILSN